MLFDHHYFWQDGDDFLFYQANFFSSKESSQYLLYLQQHISWQEEYIKLFGKSIKVPRKTSWYGDYNYSYAGVIHLAKKWDEKLIQIKEKIETIKLTTNIHQVIPHQYNAVLLNAYENGKEYMGWHSDDESSIQKNSCIASVSFGATRKFVIRKKSKPTEKKTLLLGNGSLLIMGGTFQKNYQHALPKQLKVTDKRINLTYRWIKPTVNNLQARE